MNWITDWNEIHESATYITCAVGVSRTDGSFYLYEPQLLLGWQVKRLMEKVYAALPCPPFTKTKEELK